MRVNSLMLVLCVLMLLLGHPNIIERIGSGGGGGACFTCASSVCTDLTDTAYVQPSFTQTVRLTRLVL